MYIYTFMIMQLNTIRLIFTKGLQVIIYHEFWYNNINSFLFNSTLDFDL